MPLRTLYSLLLALLAVLSFSSPVSAAPQRLALVIGNSAYQELNPLRNAANDAQAVAARLQALGFTLIDKDGKPATAAVLDLDERGFSVAIRRFARSPTALASDMAASSRRS